MFFRDFRDTDFKALMSLWKELGMGGEERGDTVETVRKTIELGGKLIILEDEKTNELIGSSWITFDGRRLFLHHFGISKRYQRQGWGEKLLNESLRFIKDQGHQVKLEVHKDNTDAIRLYEKGGFFGFENYDIYMIRDVKGLE